MNKRNLIYFYLTFFLFQNCAPFEAIDDSAIYPYAVRPEFFSDLKLVKTEVDNEGREVFSFDLVVSDANSPGNNVGYRVGFSTQAHDDVCVAKEGVVNNQNNHMQFSCKLPIADELYVSLMFLGVDGETEAKEYRY